MKRTIKTTVSLLIIVLMVSVGLIGFTACSGEKKIDFLNGEWSASSVKIGKTEIDSLKISVSEDVDNAPGKSGLVVGNKEYKLVFYVNGEEIAPESLTYYAKELRTGFVWKEKKYMFNAVLKENKKTGEILAIAEIGELEEKEGIFTVEEWISVILK